MDKLLLVDDHYCFACGMENPHGLRIQWKIEGATTVAEFTPDRKYQGWQGILHGGIIATLLDEAMTRLACEVCGGALTAEMTVRFVAPARIGELLTIRGEIICEKRRIIEMRASIHSSGALIAHSTGKAVRI
ncbi:MAG: PaaI family thioesterase [Chlamydiales bacterium]|nr:PaaI family thioesterase [Chlamydiales bacterium]